MDPLVKRLAHRNIYSGRSSTILHLYLLKSVILAFVVALSFFVMLIQLMDLLANIFRYMQNEVPVADIVRNMVLYVPKSVSYALPIAILFAVSYTLGIMYANNELIVVYASGISLAQFILPLTVMALAFSLFSFFFEDQVVLEATSRKNSLSRQLLNTSSESFQRGDIVLLGEGGRFIWRAEQFNSETLELGGIILVERDEDGSFIGRINAQSASWTGEFWSLKAVRRFYWDADMLREEVLGNLDDPAISEPPSSFTGRNKQVENMTVLEIAEYVGFLERAGLPAAAAKVEYLKRYAFACTPVVVMILAVLFTGRVKKNILLMSLLFSLVSATIYYVIQMVAVLMAKNELISPFMGAFSAVIIILLVAIPLVSTRRA